MPSLFLSSETGDWSPLSQVAQGDPSAPGVLALLEKEQAALVHFWLPAADLLPPGGRWRPARVGLAVTRPLCCCPRTQLGDASPGQETCTDLYIYRASNEHAACGGQSACLKNPVVA